MTADLWKQQSKSHDLKRQVVRRGAGFERVLFPSIKMGRSVGCEGRNERNAVVLFEVFPDVLEYREQAIELSIELDGKARKVYPDFEVVYEGGDSAIVDVTTARKLQDPQVRDKFRRIGQTCRELGYRYDIWTDVDIGRQPRLNAANEICGRGRNDLPDGLLKHARDIVAAKTTWKDLREQLAATEDELCGLVLQGYIAVDIENGLTESTRVLGPGWQAKVVS